MIKKMYERYDYVRETIAKVVLEKHQIDVDDLPPWDDEDACRRYHAKLSRDYTMLDSSTGRESLQLVQQMQPSLPPEVKPDDEVEGCEGHGMGNTQSEPELVWLFSLFCIFLPITYFFFGVMCLIRFIKPFHSLLNSFD